MKIVSAGEMREIDRLTSSKYKVPSLQLMENAGSAVAEFILQEFPQAQSVGVVCGKGNNGGDGFVAARKLHQAGKKVLVLLLGNAKELKGDAVRMYAKLPVKAASARDERGLDSAAAQRVFAADVLVDAILGTGFHPPLEAFLSAAIKALCKIPRPVVSIDIPSGMGADTTLPDKALFLRANAVVTFTAPKPALLFQEQNARVVVAQIGTPEEAITSKLQLNVATPAEVQRLIGVRALDSNKGDYGHVLIVGGSVGKAGAAAMAGLAALRAGAGLVTIAVPRSILPTVARFAPELMTVPLDETSEGTISARASGALERVLNGKTVVALGPGITTNPETAEFARTLAKHCPLPLVLDADGLNAFAGKLGDLGSHRSAPLVLTPHPGEMARLVGGTVADIQKDRISAARKLARDSGAIVVLKGHRTLIANQNGEVFVNATGNPGMAKGGTGDALTGIVAALVARKASKKGGHESAGSSDIFDAVTAAVYLHGLAGDLASDEMDENSMLGTDLIAKLPQAFRAVRQHSRDKFVQIA